MALTDDYSFMLDDTGVILNPDSSSLPFVDIDKVSGLDSPEFRESIKDHEGTDGGFMDAEFEKGRDISLEGTLYADTATMESYLDSLKENWAPSTTVLPLYLKVPGKSELLIYVKPRGVRYDWESIRRVGQLPIKFGAFAEDPRIYTSTTKGSSIPLGGISTDGLGFPIGFPFGFGVQPADTPTAYNNNGNRSTPVVFTMTGPVDTPRIVDDTSGQTMVFNIVLVTGQTLVVNTQYRTVKLNGTANRRYTLQDPNWIFFTKGENLIRYHAATSTASTLTVAYRDAWR